MLPVAPALVAGEYTNKHKHLPWMPKKRASGVLVASSTSIKVRVANKKNQRRTGEKTGE